METKRRGWEAYLHFKRRLEERYSLEINYDEYIELIDLPFQQECPVRRKRSVGIIRFNGRMIRTIRDERRRLMITALPYSLPRKSKRHQRKKIRPDLIRTLCHE